MPDRNRYVAVLIVFAIAVVAMIALHFTWKQRTARDVDPSTQWGKFTVRMSGCLRDDSEKWRTPEILDRYDSRGPQVTVAYGEQNSFMAYRANCDGNEVVAVTVLNTDQPGSANPLVLVRSDFRLLTPDGPLDKQLIDQALRLGRAYWTALGESKAPRK